MNEELIISGRDLPFIDPYLNIWHWPIPVYLFLGGLAAGILFFAAYFTLTNQEKTLPTAVKWATFITPFALILGLVALLFDLKQPTYSWRLFMTLRLESPMSWGAWTLLAITPLSMLWAASYLRELLPAWNWRFVRLWQFEKWLIRNRKALAWPMIVLSIILGIYTGILLSAFNARPLWNTALLGPLFLVSGLSTGAAVIMWMSKSQAERILFARIDLVLILVELFLIVHLFMGFLAGPEVQVEAAALFLNGRFAFPFWGLVVFLGLITPGVLEILKLKNKKIPVALPAVLILLGGLIFRFIMVEAGETTRYLY